MTLEQRLLILTDRQSQGILRMKKIIILGLVAASLTLGACGKSPSDKLASRVENAADNKADMMEKNADQLRTQAATLDNRADATRDNGESRADAIKAADMNVGAMSKDKRDAIVANKAAAVQ